MSNPICVWTFDSGGNLIISVLAENVRAFGKWINDEFGASEPEMYQLADDCRAGEHTELPQGENVALIGPECWCGQDRNDRLPRLDIVCPKHDGVVTDDAPAAPQEIQERFNQTASQEISFVPTVATPSEKKK